MNSEQKKRHIEVLTKFVFIDENNKLIFINIPKNASSTIRMNMKRVDYNSIVNSKEYKTFTVLRNPLYRSISSFFEVLKCRTDGLDPAFLRNTEYLKLYKSNKLIESFVEFVNELKRNFFDEHTFPQYWFFKDKNLNLSKDIDYFLNFDKDIQNEFNQMMRSFNKNIKISSNKRPSPQNQKDILNKFIQSNDKIRKDIETLYEEDIKLYNKYCNIAEDDILFKHIER